MVPTFWKFADLEIIGYADDREPTMLPAVVPPVFRLLANRNMVLLPPYSLQFDGVAGATAVTMEVAQDLGDTEQIRLFRDGAEPAQAGYQMWLHRDGRRVYQPIHEARQTLDQLSGEAVQRASEQLKSGQLDLAEASASEAILSNDRRVDALAIKAAIRRRGNNSDGARLMEDLARPFIESAAFVTVVDLYASLSDGMEPVSTVQKS